MIGAVKAVMNSAAGGGGGASLAGFITPSNIDRTNSNGTYVSPPITAVAQHGTGPYTYEWSTSRSDFTLSSTSDSEIVVSVSGYGVYKETVLTCIITDAAMTTVTTTCNMSVLFTNFGIDL